jgi:glycerol kinase
MTHILAIDQSTSATKALMFSANGELLARASKDHRQIYPHPTWVEHDAEEIWQNTIQMVRQVVSQFPKPSRLSITNQRETIVVFERATGKPVHNAIVWQCRRGDAICSQLKEQHFSELVREHSGLVIDTYFPASKIQWLFENQPQIRAKVADGSALIGTIETYLIYRLTNGKVFATDHTNACRTLLYDIRTLDWSQVLGDLFQIPTDALAEVRDSNANFGTTDVAGVLDAPIPIRGVMGDSQASLFALGCHQVGDTKVTLGSGSSLLLNVGETITEPEEGTVATVAWVIDGRPTYCLEGIISYSAATIQWLRDQLQLIHSADETHALAESVVDNGGVYLVPAFAGLSAPYWSPDARAAIVGMTAHTTRAHVVRAALESIAYQVRDVLEMMREQTGVTTRLIRADGGATNNYFLMQFMADLIDAEVKTSLIADSSPLGAVLCGSIGSEIASLEELVVPHGARRYKREMVLETANYFYSGWKSAIARVLPQASDFAKAP